jgi:MYXO-CTERM domain-containing protein
VGETSVTVTATDDAGNSGTCSFNVSVTKVAAPPAATGGGCGCSTSDNNPSLAILGAFGLALFAGRRRRSASN